jgi:hypothetical protein
MNRFLIICLMLFLSCAAYPQAKQKSADELKKEMAQIRQNTDWSNQAESDSAQAKIEALSKQLMMIRKMEQPQQAGTTVDSAKLQEEVDYKMKMWHQMMEGVAQGENGDILLGKPVRDEIVEAYKDDESPKIKNPYIFQELTLLCIDMSLPTVQRTIDQMDKFKTIQTLIIIGGEMGAPVDLNDLLTRAENYPLRNLYIVNFKHFVTAIPGNIDTFKDLTLLSLVNNQIKELPPEIGSLSSLNTLFIDINPIATLSPVIEQLRQLETLGIGKTDIPQSEIDQIKKLLPDCKILFE